MWVFHWKDDLPTHTTSASMLLFSLYALEEVIPEVMLRPNLYNNLSK